MTAADIANGIFPLVVEAAEIEPASPRGWR